MAVMEDGSYRDGTHLLKVIRELVDCWNREEGEFRVGGRQYYS